jgi:hypothetical protein
LRQLATIGSLFTIVSLADPATRPPPTAAETPHLQLDAIESRVLPPGSSIGGALLDAAGLILAWSPHEAGVLVIRPASVARICRSTRPLVAGLPSGAKQVGIVDARQNRLFHLRAAAGCDSGSKIDVTEEIVGAAAFGNGWILALVDSLGHGNLVKLAQDGAIAPINRARDLLGDLRLRTSFLASTPDGVTIASIRWPFGWFLIDTLGERKVLSTGFADNRLVVAGDDTARLEGLISLPVQALDSGYLQVLADPNKPLRLFAVYDRVGRLLSLTPKNVSMGPLYSLPPMRQILMLRRTNILELVVYKWRWTAE